ncbi:uncharacterized protein [Elaeis guineensis]|uniref:Uncharacterized protein LOC105045923 isoform X1 n=1 Tax=Elaeis guineensis var. tenera TaxID=51953 RepID=A0A6I9RG10_ELAGV|nr:uncharacterized protein LOC105045923 isoform X1 [Elaeis guineensis]XP_029120597.1 uncharacterized protein LOC105045923 isoform X1 [Elaeis guineensis]XP_029120598.1 uncharacterized protein LOC105045923 isoform X1 [Elaeis guineensis]
MVSSGNEDSTEEVHDGLESGTAPSLPKLREYHIRIPSLRARLLHKGTHRRRLLDFLKARPSVEWFKNLKFYSPFAIFKRTVNKREEISISIPSPVGTRRHFHIHFIRKINWSSLFNICKQWLKNPMNIALLIWFLCVAVSASMLGLLLLGLLNKAFPTTSSRNHWIEINNQVLNALFTLMSIYQHPNLFHHFILLCRWRSEDIIMLRKIYCKNGAYRPHEWAHMMVVVVLLHITCFAQYTLCGLYWGYSSKQRPEFAENFFFALGIASPVFAGLYTVYSPLGRECDSDSESDEESQSKVSGNDAKQSNKVGLKLYERRIVISEPEWVGGLFDCSDDITVGYVSFFCTCCVFGWNMERLGFGNMYVHIFTFLLLCVAPFWIFSISALNIHNIVIGDTVGIAGILLCVFGLLYGGFWRIQMRKKFKFPGNKICCGSASMTDYVQWMFCWACSLAQEVRTGNFYDIEDDSLYRKLLDGDEESQPALDHPPHDGGSSPAIASDCSSPLPTSCIAESPTSARGEECSSPHDQSFRRRQESSILTPHDVMTPPVQPLIQSQDKASDSDTTTAPLASASILHTEDKTPPPI